MSFVVYHKASTVVLKEFNTVASAKRSATCMNRNAGDVYYTYADRDTYEKRISNRARILDEQEDRALKTMGCAACGGEGGWSAGDPTNPRAMTPCSVCDGSGVQQ